MPRGLAIAFALLLMAFAMHDAAAEGAGQASNAQLVRPPDEPARRGLFAAPPGVVLGLAIVLAAASAHALLRVARARGDR